MPSGRAGTAAPRLQLPRRFLNQRLVQPRTVSVGPGSSSCEPRVGPCLRLGPRVPTGSSPSGLGWVESPRRPTPLSAGLVPGPRSEVPGSGRIRPNKCGAGEALGEPHTQRRTPRSRPGTAKAPACVPSPASGAGKRAAAAPFPAAPARAQGPPTCSRLRLGPRRVTPGQCEGLPLPGRALGRFRCLKSHPGPRAPQADFKATKAESSVGTQNASLVAPRIRRECLSRGRPALRVPAPG